MRIYDEESLRDLLSELRFRGGDSTEVEVKAARTGLPDSLPSTLCAFANMPDGGSIILGVDEGAGFAVTGVQDPSKTAAGLVSQAREAIDPPVTVDTKHLRVDGKNVVIAQVKGLPVTDKPARYCGTAYLRMADGDYRMSTSELRMIEVAKLHADEAVRYDSSIVPGTGVGDLDETIVAGFIEQVRKKNNRLASLKRDEDILRAMAVLTADGELTLAGLYALGFFPQGHFPSLGITVAQRLPTSSGRGRILDLHTFDGPVPVLLASAMRWIEQHIGVVRRYSEDGSMRELPELPLSAIREAVANALVHRDLGPDTLGVGKAVDIRLMPDKLVICSPGGLRDLSVEQLRSRQLARQEVNQRLYALCRYLLLADASLVIEGEGGGIRMMLDAATAEGLPEPDLIDSGVQFTVNMWRTDNSPHAPIPSPAQPPSPARSLQSATAYPGPAPVPAPVPAPDPDAEAWQGLRALGINVGPVARALNAATEPASLRYLADHTGLSAGQVRYALKALRAAGKVDIEGGRGSRTTRYVWVPD